MADSRQPGDAGRSSPPQGPVFYEPHDEVYHFVVLDPTHTMVLTAGAEDCWILPYACLDEMAQTPRLVSPQVPIFRMSVRMFGVSAKPIHEAPLPDTLVLDASDVPRRASNRYLALEADADELTSATCKAPFSWKPVGRFLEDSSLTRVPIQMAAVRACLARFAYPMAPFDSPVQIRTAEHWTMESLSEIDIEVTGEPMFHRMDQFDRVMELETTIGRVFFKGGPRRIAHEALVAQALHALAPEHFPATLAFDREHYWWLTPKVPGENLSNRPVHDPIWIAVVALLADVQRRALELRLERSESQHVNSLIRKPVGIDELRDAAARALALLPLGPFRDQWPPSRVARVERKLRDSLKRLANYAFPYTWTPAQFTGASIVLGDGRLCVVDVEDSYHGLPTLAMSRLLYDLVGRLQMPRPLVRQLMNAYIEAWQGRLNLNALRAAMAESWTCGPLFAFIRLLDRQARARGYWSAPDFELPADIELHMEAHALATFILEETSTHRSFRHGPIEPPPTATAYGRLPQDADTGDDLDEGGEGGSADPDPMDDPM